MDENYLISAIVGAVIGYIISLFFTGGRLRYMGRGYYSKEGGSGFFRSLFIGLIFAVVGAIVGLIIAASSE